MTGDVPLPGMPEPPPPKKINPRDPGIKVTKAGKTMGRLCEDCTRFIHQVGQARAPYPMGGRWRVASQHWVMYLCDAHKNARID